MPSTVNQSKMINYSTIKTGRIILVFILLGESVVLPFFCFVFLAEKESLTNRGVCEGSSAEGISAPPRT